MGKSSTLPLIHAHLPHAVSAHVLNHGPPGGNDSLVDLGLDISEVSQVSQPRYLENTVANNQLQLHVLGHHDEPR